MSAPLVDPQLAAFWASDPTQLRPQTQEADEQPIHPHELRDVSVGLAVAFLVVRRFISQDLQNQQPRIKDGKGFVKSFWAKHTPLWLRMSVPVIKKGYEISGINLSQDELELMARQYANDLGEYINDSSAGALIQGFQEQLASKWSDLISWHRASEAYGLDAQQMRAFVRSSINQTDEDSEFDLLPTKAKNFINQGLLSRAMRIGDHESWQSMEMGKAIAWLSQKNAGAIPPDAQKMWLTAADEKVCPQCGPLNKKRVGLDEQFETPDGNKYWAPGVHPNCRCDINLVFPEITNDTWAMVTKAESGDPYDRDRRGRFARVESRGRPVAERERQTDPIVEEMLRQSRELGEEVTRKVENPFKTKIKNPYSRGKVQNPYGKVENPARGEAKVANPFKSDKARPKIINRMVLVLLPSGGFGLKNADDVTSDEEPMPVYLWGHEYHQVLEGILPKEADYRSKRRGMDVNFNYGEATGGSEISVAHPMEEPIGALMKQAETHYGDFHAWMTPEVNELSSAYNKVWEKFLDDTRENRRSYAMRLQPEEVRKILYDAGSHHASTDDINTLRDRIIHANDDSNVEHAFVQYMEDKHLDWVGNGREDTPGYQLAEITYQLHKMNRFGHVPQILVFPAGELNDYSDAIDDGSGGVALGGHYRVSDVIYRSAALELGHDRPNNIQGLRMIYLQPKDDEGPTEEDLYSPNLGFDDEGFAYDLDSDEAQATIYDPHYSSIYNDMRDEVDSDDY